MLAERAKDRDSVNSIKAKLFTEIFIPLFAIITLISVTIYFTIKAIEILYNKEHNTDNVNIIYLYTFSGINLLVDILCITMFIIRRKDIFLEKKLNILPQLSLDDSIHSNGEFGQLHDDDMEDDFYATGHNSDPFVGGGDGVMMSHINDDTLIITEKKNLNMVSAFAHIGKVNVYIVVTIYVYAYMCLHIHACVYVLRIYACMRICACVYIHA